MRSRWLVRLALVAVAITLMGQDDSACSTETGDDGDQAEQAPDDEGGFENRAPVPAPDGTYNLNCDYLLGDFGDSGDPEQSFRFVAGGTVKNTGNIGIVARVRATWQLLGTNPVVEERRLRLRPGRTKRVNITYLATEDEIDAHQSADGDCSAKVKIIDTFGKARD